MEATPGPAPGDLAAADSSGELRLAYQKAAAVLVAFDPSKLRPLHAEPHAGALEGLLEDCVVVYDDQHVPRLALRDDVRVDALRRLETREAMLEALRDNPARLASPQQQLFEQYLAGSAPPLGDQTRERLGASLQIATWLDGLLPDAPAVDAVRQQLNMEGLLQPFRHLADDFFRGREDELRALHAYARNAVPGARPAGVLGMPSIPEPPRPLLVYGLGGVGKSTLIAKFILQLAKLPDDERVPFAYLDFDRADIVADEPVTLLIEASRQIGLQLPALRVLCEGLRDLWLRRRLRGSSTPNRRPARKGAPLYQSGVLGFSDDNDDENQSTIDEFVNIFASAPLGDTPLLLILDTFEEAQKRSADIVGDLWDFLLALQRSLPQLRLVIVGRVPVADRAVTPLPLNALSPKAAREFLVDRASLSTKLADVVVEQIGRSPLSLRLATDLLQRERDAGHDISQGVRLDRFMRAVKDYDLQGQLYWRILDHVGQSDDDVRKLAHPGLILRAITPELIRDVLAGPCGVAVASLEQAHELFNRLQRLVDLVYSPSAQVLKHRPEVRQVMLGMLRRDREQQVKEIHGRAVAFYAAREGIENRAEELYHRLALEESRAVLDARWLTGVERSLGDSWAELPVWSQNYLGGRMPLNLPADVAVQADLVDWERQAAPRAQGRLEKGQPERGLRVLRERSGRSEASLIFLLEAQILERLGRDQEARAVVMAGISAHSRHGGSRPLLALLLEDARLAERLGDKQAALQALDDANALAERYATDIQRLQAALARLRLAPNLVTAADSAALAALFEKIPDAELQQDPQLLRNSAEALGAEHTPVLRRALRLHGTEGAGRQQIAALAHSLAAWDEQLDTLGDGRLLASVVGIAVGADAPAAWNQFLTDTSAAGLPAAIDPLLDVAPAPDYVCRALIDLMRPQELFLVPGREYRKNARQVRALSGDAFTLEDSADDALFGTSPAWSHRAFTLRRRAPDDPSGEGAVVRTLYLFNLLVAWGWQRSNAEQQAVENALRGASDLIYQRTRGQIALGQAIFGGIELAAYADLSILPIERAEPTSEDFALHTSHSSPIRIGRSLLDAQGVERGWNTPVGHAALADVWMRYALGTALGPENDAWPANLATLLPELRPLAAVAEFEALPLVLPRFRRFGREAARVGLLTAAERERLVDLLLRLPTVNNVAYRRMLLSNLPLAIQQLLPLSTSARNDILALVRALDDDGVRLDDGRWPVEVVIREAIHATQGLQLSLDLQLLLDAVLRRQPLGTDKGVATDAATVLDVSLGVGGHLEAIKTPSPTTPLTLTPSQIKEFQEALLSAFPSYQALQQMAYFGLDYTARDRQPDNAARELIAWAVANGRVEDLIRAAREANPDNSRLRAFAQPLLGA